MALNCTLAQAEGRRFVVQHTSHTGKKKNDFLKIMIFFFFSHHACPQTNSLCLQEYTYHICVATPINFKQCPLYPLGCQLAKHPKHIENASRGRGSRNGFSSPAHQLPNPNVSTEKRLPVDLSDAPQVFS